MSKLQLTNLTPDKLIDQWLGLVKKAREALRPDVYQEWHFIVGSSGSLEERIELGTEALKMLWLLSGTGYKGSAPPKQEKITAFSFNQVVNIKADSVVDDFRLMRLMAGL